MMTLEQLIHDAAARGELNSLSLVAVAGGFSASFTPASTYGVNFETDPDPVIALTKVLKKTKMARPSKAPHFEPGTKVRVKADLGTGKVEVTPVADLDFG